MDHAPRPRARGHARATSHPSGRGAGGGGWLSSLGIEDFAGGTAAPPAELDPERARVCEAAYAELGVDYQTILVLRVVEGLTYAQIAKTLDIPFRTTLSRLASARGALRARLDPPQERAA